VDILYTASDTDWIERSPDRYGVVRILPVVLWLKKGNRVQRVLVIEDDPEDVRLLREILRDDRSIELEHASLLEAGLARIECGGIDLVLLDLSLPDSEPSRTVAAVRDADPGLPIIVVSGADDEGAKAHSIATGAQDYFVKGGTDGALLSRAIAHAVERQRLLNALDDARLESIRQKDLFLDQVAHEVRTPLTALLHFITLVADGLAGELNAEQQEYLSIAARNADQLAALICALTDAGKVQAGTLTLALEMLDVGSLCRSAADAVRPKALQKGIDVVVAADSELPRVCADPERSRQVLVSLLDNAVKYGPGQMPVVLDAAVDAADSRFVTLTVTDRGHGLDAQAATRIFDKLVQEPGSTVSRKGLGLGLYLAREIVECHGGRIWLDTSSPDATSFRFKLPTSPYHALPIGFYRRFRDSSGGVNVIVVDFPWADATPSEGGPRVEHIAAREIIDACVIQNRDLVVPVASFDPRSVLIVLPDADDAGTRVVAERIEGELQSSRVLRRLRLRARVGVLKTEPLPSEGQKAGGRSAAAAARLLEHAISAYMTQPIETGGAQ
jgi:signal transduction histidine kinase